MASTRAFSSARCSFHVISPFKINIFQTFEQCWMVLIQSYGLCKLHRSSDPPAGQDYSLRLYLSIQDGALFQHDWHAPYVHRFLLRH